MQWHGNVQTGAACRLRRAAWAMALALACGWPASALRAAPTADSSVVPVLNPATIGPRAGPHRLPVRPPVFFRQPQIAPAGAHLTWYGGAVVSNIQVVQVMWGTGSYLPQITATTSPSLASFYTNVLASPYLDWLGEYNTLGIGGTQQIGRGSFLGRYTITPSNGNAAIISDSQIQAELLAQIAAGHLPVPGPNTYFAIYFPHGKTINDGTSNSCVAGGFCAYHGTVSSGGTIWTYGVHPDMQAGSGCDTGCGAGAPFDNVTAVAAHELVETITDPQVGLALSVGPPLAWYDPINGEIGDLCNAQQGSLVGADGQVYVVQQEFSNAANNCVVIGPVLTTPDFSLALGRSALALSGAAPSASTTVSLAVTRGAPAPTALSVTGVPSGISTSLSAGSVTGTGSVTLSFVQGRSAPIGTFPVTVTASSGSVNHTATLQLQSTAPATGADGGDIPVLPDAFTAALAFLLGGLALWRGARPYPLSGPR